MSNLHVLQPGHTTNGVMNKGDAIVYGIVGYRGDKVRFWDGKRIVSSGSKYSDYGNVPERFLVQNGAFAPDYWRELTEMCIEQLGYAYYSEITLGPLLQDELRWKALRDEPSVVEIVINGKQFKFFIQNNKYKDDIEDAMFYYIGENTVVQADNHDWHPEADGFREIIQKMRKLRFT